MMLVRTYCLKFILQTYGSDASAIHKALVPVGAEITVTPQDIGGPAATFAVALRTQDPALAFDVCGQFGRITSVKIDES